MKTKSSAFNYAALSGAAVVFACFTMLNPSAKAQNYYWTGNSGVDQYFTTGGNWVGGGVPPFDWAPILTFDSRVVNGTVDMAFGYVDNSVVVASGCTKDITFNGAGKLILGNGGLVQLAADGSNLTFNSPIGNAGWDGILNFDVGAGRTLTVNGGIIGNDWGGPWATIVKNGTGAAVITSAESAFYQIGGLNINAGTLQLGNGTSGRDGSLPSSITTVNNNAALVYNLFGAQTAVNAINGTGTLTKNGAGALTLTGTNTYSGATTVNGGILNFAITAARSAGTAVTAAATGTVGLGVGGAGYYSETDVADLFNTTLSGFTLDAASGVAIDTTAGNFTQSTALTASRALAKLGANTLTLTNANTYTGTTTVNAGTLALSGTGANLSASSAVTVAAGGHLWFEASTDNTGPYNYNNFALNLTGQGAGSTGGGSNSGSATVFFGNNNGNTYNLGGNVTVAGGVSFATYGINNTINLGGVFSGTGDMSFTSSGLVGHTFIFSGDSSASGYTGAYKIYADYVGATVILAGGNNRLPTTATVDLEGVNGGVASLDLNGNSQQLAGLVAGSTPANAHVLNNGAGTPVLTIAITNNAETVSFAGQLGTGGTSFALTKAGAGTLTLSGTNTYSGATTVNGGFLDIYNTASVGGTSGITVNGAYEYRGHLRFDTGTDGGTISTPINVVGGDYDWNMSGTVPNNLTFTGPINLSGAALIVSQGANSTLNFNNAFHGTEGLNFAALSGGKNFFVLAGASDFTGDVSLINWSGSPQITLSGGDDRLPTTAVVRLAGATGSPSALELNGNNQTIAGLGDAGWGGADAGARRVVNTSGTAVTLTLNTTADQSSGTTIGGTDINGTAGNNLALVKTGTGTQEFTGVNTYTGNTTVLGGTLKLTQNCLAANADVSIASASGGKLELAFSGTCIVRTLTIDGVLQERNKVYSSANRSQAITGTGALSVTQGAWPRGTLIRIY